MAVRTGWAALVVAALALAPEARAQPLTQGGMVVGLSGGGSANTFLIGARFGYFVYDQLLTWTAFDYQYSDLGSVDAHQIEPSLGARYYILSAEFPISPFVDVEGSLVHLIVDRPTRDSGYTFFTVAPGGGVLIMLSSSFGFELSLAPVFYLGVDEELKDSGIVDEEIDLRWGFGFSLFF